MRAVQHLEQATRTSQTTDSGVSMEFLLAMHLCARKARHCPAAGLKGQSQTVANNAKRCGPKTSFLTVLTKSGDV